MIRKFKFSQNNHYHICNRSNDESTIFIDERDWARFLFFILAYQAPVPLFNLGRQSSYFIKHSKFNLNADIIREIISKRKVELNTFAIMPNHFHLLVKERTETGNGISWYLQRIQTGYAKYFNTKYGKRGHLFQGNFRAVPIENNDQLLYLSTYIHRNPRELLEWENNEHLYMWSSYQDYASKNRWGNLLAPNIILDQFATKKSYRNFVDTSTAKLKQKGLYTEGFLLEKMRIQHSQYVRRRTSNNPTFNVG